MGDLKERSQPKINVEMAESMELLKAELEGLKKEKSLQAFHVADELLTLEKEESLLGLKRKRSVSGGEVKKSKLDKVKEEEEVTRETSEVSKELLADSSVGKELCGSEIPSDTQNIPSSVTQLVKEKAELEQELRMKEKSGREAFSGEVKAFSEELKVKAFSEDVKVKAVLEEDVKEKAALEEVKVKAFLEEEALLASPQPAAKPANILFCNWAVPEEEVESDVKKSEEVDAGSSDTLLSTLEDSVY